MHNFKAIGLCGNARVGKDTFFDKSRHTFEYNGLITRRFAFADALKNECDELLCAHTRISAFTSNEEDKSVIRPLLVAWGTNIRRKLDEDCWIKKIEPEVKHCINETRYKVIPVITDVRYPNEVDWIHSLGGVVIHISRDGFPPANKEEEENEPILMEKSDSLITMPTLENEDELWEEVVDKTLNNILYNEARSI